MICIHPAVASSTNSLQRLQFETGLRAVIGNKYARLVPTRTSRPCQIDTHHAPVYAPVYALGQCTHCERRTNAQPAGDRCYRCRRGVISTHPTGPTGGSAA